MTTQIVITMAGFGLRFRAAGYDIPKYRIEAHNRSLLAWSMSSLTQFISDGASILFIARRDDQCRSFIAAEMPALGITSWDLIELDAPTDGQATTAFFAGAALQQDEPLLVYNIDTFVESRALPATAVRGDGWLPCFPGTGDGWSFARLDENTSKVVEVREKKRVSPHATIGLYWFTSFALYADLYQSHYRDGGQLEAGERYIAPIYNRLIADGGDVYIHEVPLDAVHPLGTPDEVEAFKAAPAPGF
jgi:NDP-sugar pyrophosphorylase family protein